MDPFYEYGFDATDGYCPRCGSDQIFIVTDDDLITGLGLYANYDIPQGLAAFESVCYCNVCEHTWIYRF